MNSTSFSYPSRSDVLAELGEKTTGAIAQAIQRARTDLGQYRSTFPRWVANASERGLANWISDRIWDHLAELLDGVPEVTTTEKGPLREFTVGIAYRFRVKRHDEAGNVSSYPTEAFLDFTLQPNAQLPGMEETRLIAGYDWLKDSHEIGAAVISLRDGTDNIIWKESLPEPREEGEGTANVVVGPEPQPPAGPTVDVPESIGRRPGAAAADQ